MTFNSQLYTALTRYHAGKCERHVCVCMFLCCSSNQKLMCKYENHWPGMRLPLHSCSTKQLWREADLLYRYSNSLHNSLNANMLLLMRESGRTQGSLLGCHLCPSPKLTSKPFHLLLNALSALSKRSSYENKNKKYQCKNVYSRYRH